MGRGKIDINLSGVMGHDLMKVQCCAREIQRNYPNHIANFEVNAMYPTQWDQYLK
jgi:cyclophilin family peptidyl-prolyl cis-trans isomerase